MSCSVIDLKAYLLGEVPGRQKAATENHIDGCPDCREELERLRLTHAALLSLEDVEVPRRIAFVSDAVFEPRWWQRVWNSGPALGFASALVLALAILVHAFARPVPAPLQAQIQPAAVVTSTAVASGDVDRKIHDAVVKAVAQVEADQQRDTAKLVDAAVKRSESRHRSELLAAEDTIRLYQQQMGRMLVAYNDQSRSGQ